MKVNKTLAEALNEMFGPNPCKLVHVATSTMRYKAFQELERIGLVRITRPGSAAYECLREITRRMDEGKTLCEVFSGDKTQSSSPPIKLRQSIP